MTCVYVHQDLNQNKPIWRAKSCLIFQKHWKSKKLCLIDWTFDLQRAVIVAFTLPKIPSKKKNSISRCALDNLFSFFFFQFLKWASPLSTFFSICALTILFMFKIRVYVAPFRIWIGINQPSCLAWNFIPNVHHWIKIFWLTCLHEAF